MHPTVSSELICMTTEKSQCSSFSNVYVVDTILHEKNSFKTKSPGMNNSASRLEMFGEDKLITAFDCNLRIQDLRHHGWRGDPRETHHRDIAFSSNITSFAVNPTSENYVVVGILDECTRTSDLTVLGLGRHNREGCDGGDMSEDDDHHVPNAVADSSSNATTNTLEIEEMTETGRESQFKGSSFAPTSWCRFGIP